MRARIVDPGDRAWTDVLGATSHDVYHLPSYVATAAEAEGGRGAALLVEDGPGRRLLLPMVIRSIAPDLDDAVSPYGYPGPLVEPRDDAAFVAEAMACGVEELRARRIVSFLVRLHPILEVDGLERVGTMANHGRVVVIDLGLSEAELWQGTRLNHRRDIAEAKRLGYRFSEERSEESHQAFVALYRATMKRVDAADYYNFDDAYFASLREALADHLMLATVRIGDKLAAAGWFTLVDGIVQLHLAGWDHALAQQSPTKLLYHEVRMLARRRGDRWMCLGGGHGVDDALLHFKLGFSMQTRTYRTVRIVVDAEQYQRLVAESSLGAELVTDDEMSHSYFPAYRARPPASGA